MSWARFDDKLIDDPDVDEFNIGAAGIGLFVLIVITGQKRQNPRVPMATIRRLPGGNRRNLAKLTAAGWLIEIEKGNAFYIRSLDKYSNQKDGAAPKKSKFGPAPDPDPAPPVPPRISEVRRTAGSKGGNATAAKRRHRPVESSPDDVTNFDTHLLEVVANDAAKPIAKPSDFAGKNGANGSKNGHENGEILPATHAGASDPNPVSREDINLIANPITFDLSPSVPSASPIEGPPAAERSKGSGGSVDLSLWPHRKRGDVNLVAGLFDDTKNIRRHGQLWDACDQAGLVGEHLWAACQQATQTAKAAGKVRTTPGAMFRGMLANKLIEAGHPVPVGSVDERAEIHAAAKASLASADGPPESPPDAEIHSEQPGRLSESPEIAPPDARDGPAGR